MAENINPKYDKFLTPLQEITAITEALLDGAFGAFMGDQREGLKRLYTFVWALRTLLMDIISNLELADVARRDDLRQRFDSYLNPLNDIPHSLLDGIDGPLDDEQAFALQFIADMAGLLQRYAAQLWCYSELHNGRCAFHPQTIPVDQILIPADWPDAANGVTLALQPLETVPSITGDVAMLRYMLRQLVSNAVQHTAHGYIHVSVNAYADRVAISVTDTGKGIAPEHLPHVFKPFYQVDDQAEGLGLGLSIVRSICTLHGARVDCQPHPHGTDVTVIFNIS